MKIKFFSYTSVLIVCLITCFHVSAQQLSETYVAELMNTSFAKVNEKDYHEALSGFHKVAEITGLRRTPEESQAYFCSQTMSVMCYQYLGKYEKAFHLSDKVLKEICSTASEEKDLRDLFVTNGYLTALEYLREGNRRFGEARDILIRLEPYANEDMRKRIMKQKPVSWYMEGGMYLEEQQYEHAADCMGHALSGFNIAGLSDNVRETLCHLAEINCHLCKWTESLRLYRKAESYAENDEDRMDILVQQWKLCDVIGDNEALCRVSELMDSLAAESNDSNLKFEYNLFRGKQAERTPGGYKLAERWYMQNENLIGGMSDALKFKYYVSLRDLYQKERNWEKSLEYAVLAKENIQKYYSPTESGYYTEYGFIANIFKHKGDRETCFKNLDTLFMAVPFTNEPRELNSLYCTRASAYAYFGDFDKALDDCHTADSLLSTKYSREDSDRVFLLSMMGGLEHQLKHYKESEKLYARYAEETKKIYGGNGTDYIDALTYLANSEAFAGHFETATRNYSDAAHLLKRQVKVKWKYLSSSEKNGYWSRCIELLHNMTPFALKAGECQSAFTKACYDGLVLTKAFLLESEQSVVNLLKNKGTQQDMEDYSIIQYLQSKITNWERKGHEYADSIVATSTKVKLLESALARRCRAYGDAMSFVDIDFDHIKGALKDKEVLLDYTDHMSSDKERVYSVYVVSGNQKYPLLKELFQESSLDSLNVRYPYQYYSGPIGVKLYECLWKPIEEYVPEGTTVYYVPSQLLFGIAFESIPTGDGKLLGDRYHFVRLSSSRELIKYNSKLSVASSRDHSTAVLYGGLQYSIDDETMALQAKRYNISPEFAMRGNDEFVPRDSMFYDLPGSMVEIESINNILKKEMPSVIPYSGKEGTAESFLSMSGNAPQVLHLATHGFYYSPIAAAKVDYLRGYSDAMSLSGLVLSGGNAAWLGHKLPDNVLGGILTASDIARMDLSGVELVVLSACHSGKGKATSEGLYGLQRAFKKAGAKTMVMSLWAESDVVGPEFMSAFYDNLITKAHWDKNKAFDAAKEAIRRKYPDSPSYWAGFVILD